MKSNPIEISFYRLTTLPILKAAPKLIEKIYYSGQRLVVIAESEELMKTVDDGLWVYSTKHFIPHATFADESPEDQPVFLTTKLENPNNASIMMALGCVDLDNRPLSKLASVMGFEGDSERRTAVYTEVHEDSSTESTCKSPTEVEFRERSNAPVSKLLYMFDGNIPQQLEFARKKWKLYQGKGHTLTYWQQNISGGWEKQG